MAIRIDRRPIVDTSLSENKDLRQLSTAGIGRSSQAHNVDVQCEVEINVGSKIADKKRGVAVTCVRWS